MADTIRMQGLPFAVCHGMGRQQGYATTSTAWMRSGGGYLPARRPRLRPGGRGGPAARRRSAADRREPRHDPYRGVRPDLRLPAADALPADDGFPPPSEPLRYLGAHADGTAGRHTRDRQAARGAAVETVTIGATVAFRDRLLKRQHPPCHP